MLWVLKWTMNWIFQIIYDFEFEKISKRIRKEKRLQSRTLSESPFDEKKSSKDSIKYVSTYHFTNTMNKTKRIRIFKMRRPLPEIFREIYIFFPRSEKKIPLVRIYEKTDTILKKKIKEHVRPTFDWIRKGFEMKAVCAVLYRCELI